MNDPLRQNRLEVVSLLLPALAAALELAGGSPLPSRGPHSDSLSKQSPPRPPFSTHSYARLGADLEGAGGRLVEMMGGVERARETCGEKEPRPASFQGGLEHIKLGVPGALSSVRQT